MTGAPVMIGDGLKPLASSQTLSENSQMASGAGRPREAPRCSPRPPQHTDTRENGQRTTDEAGRQGLHLGVGQEVLGLCDDAWERYALGDVPDQASVLDRSCQRKDSTRWA
jgi:hypothetical protein